VFYHRCFPRQAFAKQMDWLNCTLKFNGPIMGHQIMFKNPLLARYLFIKRTIIGFVRGRHRRITYAIIFCGGVGLWLYCIQSSVTDVAHESLLCSHRLCTRPHQRSEWLIGWSHSFRLRSRGLQFGFIYKHRWLTIIISRADNECVIMISNLAPTI